MPAICFRNCWKLWPIVCLAIPLLWPSHTRPMPGRSCAACAELVAWLPAAQKLQEGAEVSLGPSEVESAEDFFLATSLRHRCVLIACTAV